MISEPTVLGLLEFRKRREWEQFHNLRTLASALVVEAAELLEIVQWSSDAELPGRVADRRQDIEGEVADIAILLAYLVHDLGIDLNEVINRKLVVNEERYPVDKARGSSRKYSEL